MGRPAEAKRQAFRCGIRNLLVLPQARTTTKYVQSPTIIQFHPMWHHELSFLTSSGDPNVSPQQSVTWNCLIPCRYVWLTNSCQSWAG